MGYLEDLAALKGKVAVVIGGAKGMGAETTLALARAGVDLFVGDWDAEALAATAKAAEAEGVRVFSKSVDVLKPDEVEAFYDAVEAAFDHLDIVVNLAGGTLKVRFMESNPDIWADDIQRNFRYVVQSTYRAIPLLRKSGRGGSIINYTTVEAHRGAANLAVYAGAKAATENFSRSIAVEFAPERIRVNTLAMDHTPSAGNRAAMAAMGGAEIVALRDKFNKESYGMIIPLGQQPPEIEPAKSVLFLASDLSAYITGTTLHPDGGTWAASGITHWPGGDGFSPVPGVHTIKKLFDS